jgi:hypothetical protein
MTKQCSHTWYMRQLGIQCTKCLIIWEKWMDDPIEERLKYMEENGI